jgi:phosphate starvation-inducible membrane PsiE
MSQHSSPIVTPEHARPWGVAHYLALAERFVLIMIAVVLSALAVLLLGAGVIALVQAVMAGSIRDQAIEILDTVLLVMMTMEIVYTVTLSLESHTLVAEPFLVIGAIAAIRRMLVITAESTKLEVSNPDAFRNTLIELFLLAIIVIAMAASIYILRRSQSAGKALEERLPE